MIEQRINVSRRDKYTFKKLEEGNERMGGRGLFEVSLLVAIILFSFKDISVKYIYSLIKSHWQSVQIWGTNRSCEK